MKWKAKGYELTEVEKAALQADQAAKLQQRVTTQKAQQEVVASAVRDLLAIAPPALAEHGYLQAKQVRPNDLRVVPADGSAAATCRRSSACRAATDARQAARLTSPEL